MGFGLKKVLFGVAAAGLLALTACESNNIREIPLHKLTTDFVSFGNGSVWTYVKQGDTTVKEIVTASNFMTGSNRYDEVQNEFVAYDLISNLNFGIQVRAESGLKDPIDRIVFVTQTDVQLVYGPLFWCNGSDFTGNSGDTVNSFATYMVGDMPFSNVVELRPFNDPQFPPMYKSIAISREIGIVKKEYLNGDVYLLRSYKVMK
jgi:hypothetical protein